MRERAAVALPKGGQIGGFEAGIAPLLGVQHTQQSSTVGRAVVGLDHALYGIVVSGRLAPEPELFSRERRRGRGQRLRDWPTWIRRAVLAPTARAG